MIKHVTKHATFLVLAMFIVDLRTITFVSRCRVTAATPHASRVMLWTFG
jgi:hypothetical protein